MPRVFDTDIQGLATITAMQERLDNLEAKVADLDKALSKTLEICRDLHKLSTLNREATELLSKSIELVHREMANHG